MSNNCKYHGWQDTDNEPCPYCIIDQLRKENKCLIKIIEERDVLISASYKTNAENHKLSAEVAELTNTVGVREDEVTGLLGINAELRAALANMTEIASLAQEAAATAEKRAVTRCAEIAEKTLEADHPTIFGTKSAKAIKKEFGL